MEIVKNNRYHLPALLWKTVLIACTGIFLLGCQQIETDAADSAAPKTDDTVPETIYEAPEMRGAGFHADAASGSPGAQIDISCVSEGYVAVAATADSRLKFQVLKDDETYNYDIARDGTPSVFPLQCGNGSYHFRIMQNIVDKKYAMIYEITTDVVMNDEFDPYLRPSDYVNYTEDSLCVARAAELASTASSQVDVIKQIYAYVCKNVKYDTHKAETVQSGYLPDPDETLETGKGICFDYASLAASMLRSQGIPTKVIFGYVSPNDLYHAWNMFYTEETGWITAQFAVDPEDWTRMDLTFSANGADNRFVGDGSNYSDVYQY